MDAADLDEASHEHNKSDAHQQHCPPVSLDNRGYIKGYVNTGEKVSICICVIVLTDLWRRLHWRELLHFLYWDTHHYPFGNILIQFCIEDGFLKPGQRAVGVHQATPHEHVTVALKVIAG